jgi:hypothetical protein
VLNELGFYFIHNDNIYGVVFNSNIKKSNLTLTEFILKADSTYDKLTIYVPTAEWADRVLFLEDELASKLSIRFTGVDYGVVGYFCKKVAKDTQFILKHEFGVDSEVVDDTLSFTATDRFLDFLQSHSPLLLGD